MLKAFSPEAVIPVYLLESHPLAAAHLREVLAGNARFSTRALQLAPGEDNPCSMAEECSTFGPVVMMDGDLVQSAPEKYFGALRFHLPDPKVLLLHKSVPDETLYRFFLLGTRGFVAYESIRNELPDAIQAIWDGRLWCADSVREKLMKYVSLAALQEDRSRNKLTRREKDIACLLGNDLSNKEIGNALNITERTVKFHLDNIFTKFGVRNRYAAARIFAEVQMLYSSAANLKTKGIAAEFANAPFSEAQGAGAWSLNLAGLTGKEERGRGSDRRDTSRLAQVSVR
jgi:DNA-binding NarL/FixJ family response regulator